MEALRNSLLIPGTSTFCMTLGCVHAMKQMIKTRYAAKDDNGKPLLPHPYSPWVKVPEKNQKQADDAYRGFKMYENVKEWTFLSIPLMWTSFVFSGALPFMTDARVDAMTAITTFGWMFGTLQYISGYQKSTEDRILGFKVRTRTTLVWLGVSVVSIGYTALQRFGIVA